MRTEENMSNKTPSKKMVKPILKMVNIEKTFPGVKALSKVTFSVNYGEIHGLVGENGAGKSTLMKILSGAYQADKGSIEFDGAICKNVSPATMIQNGVAVIYQEFAQAPHLTVAENIFLNRLPTYSGGIIDWKRLYLNALDCMQTLGFTLNPNTELSKLSVADRQMVEIARAVSQNAKLIVLDEPSAVLGEVELNKLFDSIRSLQKKGVSLIYISHRLKEVFQICQGATVLRDGQVVRSAPITQWTTETLIQSMVGRTFTNYFPQRKAKIGQEVLRVTNLGRKGVLRGINLTLRSGEILGICGLAGAGRSELLKAIYGADIIDEGEIWIHNKAIRIFTPRKAVQLGIGFAPEDRKTEGLFIDQSVKFNITASRLKKFVTRIWLNLKKETAAVQKLVKSFQIKTPALEVPVGNLSGGNQQKCVLSKQINASCDILLVDEPTRGVDVGAKREIYQILLGLTEKEGLAILMVSSELPEIIGLCDRLLVMREGSISAELHRTEFSEEAIMKNATFH
jgi:ribose transport system ATP-binding protein